MFYLKYRSHFEDYTACRKTLEEALDYVSNLWNMEGESGYSIGIPKKLIAPNGALVGEDVLEQYGLLESLTIEDIRKMLKIEDSK